MCKLIQHRSIIRYEFRLILITLAITRAVSKDSSQVIPEASSQAHTQELILALIQDITQELKTIQAHILELTQVVTQVTTQELHHTQEHIPEHTQVTTQEHTQEIQY